MLQLFPHENPPVPGIYELGQTYRSGLVGMKTCLGLIVIGHGIAGCEKDGSYSMSFTEHENMTNDDKNNLLEMSRDVMHFLGFYISFISLY